MEEMIEVHDGEQKRILQVGVKLVVIRNGKILLLKRAVGKYGEITTDRWDIVGGRINSGTTLMENLAREVFEETHMEITGVPTLIAAQDILKGTEKHVVRLTYVGQATGEPILDEEHDAYAWLSLDEIKNLELQVDDFFSELVKNNLVIV